MKAEMNAQGLSAAELERRAFDEPRATGWRIRNWMAQGTGLPRDPAHIERIAGALGVFPLWLRDGISPRRAGEGAGDPHATGDEILSRRAFAMRLQGERKRCRIATPEEACVGLTISGERWRSFEAGEVSPTLVELRVISERLGASLDFLVSDRVVLNPHRQLYE